MKKLALGALFAATALVLAPGVASADDNDNQPPPSGNAIFSLDGQPLPHEYTTYTTSFVATGSTTDVAFALRDDPSFFSLDDVSVTATTGGANLISNGDFEQGPVGGNAPADWSYLNLYNAEANGVVESNCGVGGSLCYFDGAIGSYDTITQAISTTAGTAYTLTFDLTEGSDQVLGSAVSTDGEDGESGINVVAYAGGSNPTISAAPEPGAWALLLGGVGILGAMLRVGYARRREDEVKSIATA